MSEKCPKCGKEAIGRVQTLDENLNSQFAWFCENNHEWSHLKCFDPIKLIRLIEKACLAYPGKNGLILTTVNQYLTGNTAPLKALAGEKEEG